MQDGLPSGVPVCIVLLSCKVCARIMTPRHIYTVFREYVLHSGDQVTFPPMPR
jgi:hypothetical protein